MLRVCLLFTLAAAFATAAAAQTIEIKTSQASVASAEQVRISVGVNMFVPAPSDDGEQALRAQEVSRKMIYELAGRECAVLRETLASECRLESVNVNVQRSGNRFGNQGAPEGFNVNGNIGYRIVPR
jgi:hypothetical protein